MLENLIWLLEIRKHMRIKFFNNKYKDDILGKAKTSRIPGMDWQDIAQEIDIALWLNLSKFQGKNNAQERTFAVKIMQNKILDLVKAANRQKRFLDSYHLIFSQLDISEEGQWKLDIARPII